MTSPAEEKSMLVRGAVAVGRDSRRLAAAPDRGRAGRLRGKLEGGVDGRLQRVMGQRARDGRPLPPGAPARRLDGRLELGRTHNPIAAIPRARVRTAPRRCAGTASAGATW